MDMFDSPWLIKMLEKSSPTPQGRLLSLFDILDDWLKAPNAAKMTVTPGDSSPLLKNYCMEQAKSLKANNPELLADHIVLIAQNAAQHASAQPESNSLIHAKKVAAALIQAQIHNNGFYAAIKQSRPALYGIAASFIMLFGITAAWAPVWMHSQSAQTQTAQNGQSVNDAFMTITPEKNKAITAIDASRMYAKYEQMRQGTCQFPEALQIPDKHKSIYLENVVGSKLPTDLDDLRIANFYLEKVRCNFTPMLMATSR